MNPAGAAATPEDAFEAIRSLETPEHRLSSSTVNP
jgi:hypothetical protein